MNFRHSVHGLVRGSGLHVSAPRKWFIVLALVAVSVIPLTLIACGGNEEPPAESATAMPAGEDSPPAESVAEVQDTSQGSLDEYLEFCRAVDEEEVIPPGDPAFTEVLGQLIEQMEAQKPPQEVVAWHDATLAFWKALREALDDAPEQGESEDEYLARVLVPVFLRHGPAVEEAENGMNQDVAARMIEAGCFDEETLSTEDDFEAPETLLGTFPAGEKVRIGDYEVQVGYAYREDLFTVQASVRSVGDGPAETPDCSSQMSLQNQEGTRRYPTQLCADRTVIGREGRYDFDVGYGYVPQDTAGLIWTFSDGDTGAAFDLSSLEETVARIGGYEVTVVDAYGEEDLFIVEGVMRYVGDGSAEITFCDAMSLKNQEGLQYALMSCERSGIRFKVGYADVPENTAGLIWVFSDGETEVDFGLSPFQ